MTRAAAADTMPVMRTPALTVLVAAALLLPAAADAKVICVPSTSLDASCTESQNTIGAAALAAAGSAGKDTIRLGEGAFPGTTTFGNSNPVDIIGLGRDRTTLVRSTTGNAEYVLRLQADSSSVRDLKVDMGGAGDGVIGIYSQADAASIERVDVTRSVAAASAAGVALGGHSVARDLKVTLPLAATGAAFSLGVSITAGSTVEDVDAVASTALALGSNDTVVRHARLRGSTVAQFTTPGARLEDALLIVERTPSGNPGRGVFLTAFDYVLDAKMSGVTIVGDGGAGLTGIETSATDTFPGPPTTTAAVTGAGVVLSGLTKDVAASGVNATVNLTQSLVDPAKVAEAGGGDATLGAGTLSADPRFKDAAGGDYRLRFDSPAVDTGDPSVQTATDLGRLPRVVNGRADMGAFEFQRQAPSVAGPTGAVVVVPGQTFTFKAAGSDPDGQSLTYAWSFSDGSQATGASVDKAFAAVGGYTATVTVTNQIGLTATAQVPVTVVALPVVDPPRTQRPKVTITKLALSRTGVLSVTLRCTQASCAGKVSAKRRTDRAAASKRYSLALNRTATVKVTLTRAQKRALKRSGRLALTVTATTATGKATRTQTVKPPKKPRRRK